MRLIMTYSWMLNIQNFIKKFVRHYQNDIILDGEDPDKDYSLILECIRQDLEDIVEGS